MKKDFETTEEMKKSIDAQMEIEEINQQKREATNFLTALENLDGKGLDYFEGYLTSLEHQESFKQIQYAMALYYIHKNQLYKAKGFRNFVDYCKAIGMSNGAGYEWVRNIDEYGVKDFCNLLERIGLKLRFFREVKALPEEVKTAVVKGEKIEINDKEYDLAKGGKELREVVKSLVHEVNKAKTEKKGYDTHETWNKKLANKDVQIQRLTAEIANFKTPLEDAEAIKKLENLKIQLRGVIRIIEAFDAKKYSEEVKTELLLTAQFAHDRGELCLGRILDEIKCDRVSLEVAEESFLQNWDKEEA